MFTQNIALLGEFWQSFWFSRPNILSFNQMIRMVPPGDIRFYEIILELLLICRCASRVRYKLTCTTVTCFVMDTLLFISPTLTFAALWETRRGGFHQIATTTPWHNASLGLRSVCVVDVGFGCISPTVAYQRRLYVRGYTISGGFSMVLKKLKIK